MNIIERFNNKKYVLQEGYRFVRIIENKTSGWYNKYYNMIFVVRESHNCVQLRFPFDRTKLEIKSNRIPLITISYSEGIAPIAVYIRQKEVYERPVNWDEYINEINKEV
jgi:hypothetical protein